jgi:alkylation response protein AidB-like acyl-CoA dehydrogenase
VPFQLADDERLIQDTVRGLAKRLGLDAAQDRDRHDRFPREELQQAAQLGLSGILDPQSGLTASHFILAIDALAEVDPTLAACVTAHNAALAVAATAQHPSAQGMAQGELAALLVSEEAVGSDPSRLGARATASGTGWKLSGQKVWGINAEAASRFFVLATTDKGPTFFVVPAQAPGVALGANDPVMGLRSAGMRTVYFSNVQLDAASIVGQPGSGLALLAVANNAIRLGAAAALCGAVGGALEAAARFAETRIQFQNPIGTYQAVSDGVTEMDIQLAAARALCLQAAANQTGPDAAVWSARAKAFCANMAVPMTRQAIRIQGGTGFMREGGTERFARDVRALQFLGDSTPLQRDVVKRAVLPGIEYPADP